MLFHLDERSPTSRQALTRIRQDLGSMTGCKPRCAYEDTPARMDPSCADSICASMPFLEWWMAGTSPAMTENYLRLELVEALMRLHKVSG